MESHHLIHTACKLLSKDCFAVENLCKDDFGVFVALNGAAVEEVVEND